MFLVMMMFGVVGMDVYMFGWSSLIWVYNLLLDKNEIQPNSSLIIASVPTSQKSSIASDLSSSLLLHQCPPTNALLQNTINS